MANFDGKRFLVVGGSSGMGLATAKAAAEAGAAVTIASRSSEKLQRAASAIVHGVQIMVLDTASMDDLEKLQALEPWDHVAITSAETPMGGITNLDLDSAKAAMESKFWGAYRVAKVVRLRPSGSLTLVSGVLSVRPSANAVLQGAINAAIEGLARGLAVELAPIRVNAISPGLIATELWAGMPQAQRDGMFERVAKSLPARRVGYPEDIASAILFVAGNPFTTGATIQVDGGGAIA